MGFMDFMKESPKVELTVESLCVIMKEATKAEFLMNGVLCEVPHRHMHEMVTGLRHPAEVIKSTPCFIPEEGNPYPLCKGRGLDICVECQLRGDYEPPEPEIGEASNRVEKDETDGG